MTTVSVNFPGPLSTKRRRMRSGGGNVSVTLSGNDAVSYHNNGGNMYASTSTQDTSSSSPPPEGDEDENVSEQKTTQTSKCKNATTIPIFLKKTYKMVDTCDPSIASWTEDGDMFVVKDPDLFATQVIPQYFDHNKFSSFARQLNFYGFRKMQSKPIRNSDFDAGTAKHVTFYNENFKRGRCDLLKKIQRSTRGGGTATPGDQSREVVFLREQVSNLEMQVNEVASQMEERVRRLELEMLSRLEQMMITVQQQQRTQLQLEKATSIGSVMSQQNMSMPAPQQQQILPNQMMQQFQNSISNNNWDVNTYNAIRASSISSAANSVANIVGTQPSFMLSGSLNAQVHQQQQQQSTPPTLPPHPKQKQLPSGIVPGSMAAPPDRMNSLRGISTLSRGLSGLTRGASVESSASAVLMRNSWEDKFFSMLMLEGNDPGGMNDVNLSPTPIGGPVTISDNSASVNAQSSMLSGKGPISRSSGDDDLSDVSSGDLP